MRQLLGIGATTASFLLALPISTLSDPTLHLQSSPAMSAKSAGQPSAAMRSHDAAGTVPPAAVSPASKIDDVAKPGEELDGLATAEGATRTATAGTVLSLRRTRVAAPAATPGACEPDRDLDPLHPGRLAVSVTAARASEKGVVAYPVYLSGDAGSHWERSRGEGPFPIADPGLEFDSQGRLFLSGLDASADGSSRGVVVARSDDAGRSFA